MAGKFDLYEHITDTVVRMLEDGTAPWRKPWTASSSGPRNIEGRPYRGINVFLLLAVAMENEYESPFWLTFNQAKERGGKVRKGEKSTMVVFWKRILVDDDDNPGKKKTIPMLRYYRVFNVAQVDGLKLPARVTEPVEEAPDHEPIEEAQAIVDGYPSPPRISFGG